MITIGSPVYYKRTIKTERTGSVECEPEIIENGICDACGKEAQYLQVVNCAPVVNACICRACLETGREDAQRGQGTKSA
jgi:hypothetical protein